MTFCIITHVPHSKFNENYFGYSPYVNEMNIWIKNAEKVIIVAPLSQFKITAIHQNYKHNNILFIAVPSFSILGLKATFQTIFHLPKIIFLLFKAMQQSDHIHLRCPGNMGLLGSIVQILFPKKKKTAKYAGNWDSASIQPISYKIQKFILSSTSLSKNMQVLVYGIWKNQSKNIKSFFTATYLETEVTETKTKDLKGQLKFIFVGSLTSGKQPLVAVEIVRQLSLMRKDVTLAMYGEGAERKNLEDYILTNNLAAFVFLKGNISKEQIKIVYQESHFLILPSKSEGWPKVIAEAMFWGCLPIATDISCIPSMLDYGNRGILLSNSLENDCKKIEEVCDNQNEYEAKVKEGIKWSRNYTIDKFDREIKKLLKA